MIDEFSREDHKPKSAAETARLAAETALSTAGRALEEWLDRASVFIVETQDVAALSSLPAGIRDRLVKLEKVIEGEKIGIMRQGEQTIGVKKR